MAIIVHIMGRLGRDPEVRHTATGQKITQFTMATNIRRQGEEVAVWFRVSVFGDRFDKMMSYLKKGSSVYVVGSLDPRQYQDKEGKTQQSLDVVADHISFLPSQGGERQASTEGEQHNAPAESRSNSGPADSRPQPLGSVAFQPRQPFQGVAVGASPQAQSEEDDDLPF